MDREHRNENLTMGHEPSAINVRVVWMLAVGLVAIVVVSFVLMAELWEYFSGTAPTPGAVALAEREAVPLPAGVPRLNPDQTVELKELRATERQLLHEYAWIDQQAGVARIPIDRAMEIISALGLPKTVGQPTAAGSNSHE